MPPHPRYVPRHAGPRRRPRWGTAALVTGTLASAALAVGPATATESASATQSASALRPVASKIDRTASVLDDRGAAVSRSISPFGLSRLVPPARVVPGSRLVEKPPPPPPPWVLPVTGYHLTGRFGQVSGLWSTVHTGLDFAAPEGTPIRSIGPGVVVSTGYEGSYGNKTVVKLDDGTVLWYCHQSRFGVRAGQRLAAGQLVGYVGSTGNVTGPHLHLEVHPHGQDQAIDPAAWLPEHHLHP